MLLLPTPHQSTSLLLAPCDINNSPSLRPLCDTPCDVRHSLALCVASCCSASPVSLHVSQSRSASHPAAPRSPCRTVSLRAHCVALHRSVQSESLRSALSHSARLHVVPCRPCRSTPLRGALRCVLPLPCAPHRFMPLRVSHVSTCCSTSLPIAPCSRCRWTSLNTTHNAPHSPCLSNLSRQLRTIRTTP
jgi:hypothetical protein